MNDWGVSLKNVIDDSRLPPAPSVDELHRRTRRHRSSRYPHRRLSTGIVIGLVVLVAVTLAVVYGPRRAPTSPRSTNESHRAPTIHTDRPTGPVTTATFPGAFRPDEAVGVGRSLWLIDDSGPGPGPGCPVRRLNARTLKVTGTFSLSTCGVNAVAGLNGSVDVETFTGRRGTNNFDIHIESLSTTTGVSTTFAPTVLTVAGSGIVHNQLAYFDGWLWLDARSEIVQISPVTGAVVSTTTGVPADSFLPLVSPGPGGLWLAGDASPSSVIDIRPLSSHPPSGMRPFLTALPPLGGSQPDSVTIDWMSPFDGRMWLGLTTTTPLTLAPASSSMTQHIVVVNGSGAVVTRSPVESDGSALVPVGFRLFTVATPSCARLVISRLDPVSLRTTKVATRPWPNGTCVGTEPRAVTTAGGDIFVLDQGYSDRSGRRPTLYRFTP